MSCGFPDSDEVPAPAGMAVALPLAPPPPFGECWELWRSSGVCTMELFIKIPDICMQCTKIVLAQAEECARHH